MSEPSSGGGFVHGAKPEAEGHAAVGAEGIDGERERGSHGR